MHVIVWHYQVRTERIGEFAAAYGAEGAWVQLFRKGAGYRGTKLVPITGTADQFVTFDVWQSAAAFEQFFAEFAGEYHRLDQHTADLTLSERRIGAFDTESDSFRE